MLSLRDLSPIDEPIEDGQTFEDNAEKKAVYYARQTGLCCVADDSGLEVDALNGEPGVYSARYAGAGCTDDDNNRKLLHHLGDLSENRRTARFVCCAAFAEPDGLKRVVRGTVEGRIALAPVGSNGFGYDPLFVPNGYTETFAQLDPKTKNAISHRGEAFRKMKDYLESLQ